MLKQENGHERYFILRSDDYLKYSGPVSGQDIYGQIKAIVVTSVMGKRMLFALLVQLRYKLQDEVLGYDLYKEISPNDPSKWMLIDFNILRPDLDFSPSTQLKLKTIHPSVFSGE